MKQLQVPIDNEMNALERLDPSFRFTFSNDDLSEYHKGFVNWHKQTSVEISVVCEGAVDVYVLKQKKTVSAGGCFLHFARVSAFHLRHGRAGNRQILHDGLSPRASLRLSWQLF